MDVRYVPVLLPMLRSTRKILVVSHANPDGDAVASMLALSSSLRLGRWDARALSPSPVPESYRFLPGWEGIEVCPDAEADASAWSRVDDLVSTADVIICLDCTDLGRLALLGTRYPERFSRATIVNIDHHRTNGSFGQLNIVDESSSAVSEQLAVLMQHEDLPITRDIASTLLAGIMADTMGLRTSSTSARTLKVAADLVDRGASISEISERIFNTRSPRSLMLWGHVLTQTRYDRGLAWAGITRAMLEACRATLEDADNLVEFVAAAEGIGGAFLFSEQGDGVRVSIRTSAVLDAADLAGVFGGGGHPRAAGCTVRGSMADAQALVMAEARRRLDLVTFARDEDPRIVS